MTSTANAALDWEIVKYQLVSQKAVFFVSMLLYDIDETLITKSNTVKSMTAISVN